MSDLLHAALTRATAQSSAHPDSPDSPPSLSSLSLSDLIPVLTPAGSAYPSPTSSAASSRASSPSRKGKGKGKPPRDKTKERAMKDAGRLDPLQRFPQAVNARIFGMLLTGDLLRAGRVSKKWRRSQTISESGLGWW